VTLSEVMARTDDAVRHASPYWLATARTLLADVGAAQPLTLSQRRRLALIEAELRERET